MPLPLLALGIAAAVAGLAVIAIKFLGWEKILGFFRNKQKLLEQDKENIAFTLNKSLENGHYSTVSGIFNKSTNQLVDGEKYEAEKVDKELLKHHKENELVIYPL